MIIFVELNVKNMLKSLVYGLLVMFYLLFIFIYMLVLLLFINLYLFGVSNVWDEGVKMLLLLVFLYIFFIFVVFIMVMYFLGMIQDVQVWECEDCIGLYFIMGMLYLWVYYNFLQNGQLFLVYVFFMLGMVVVFFISFMINIFFKISVYVVGMGGFIGMVVISMVWFSYGSFMMELLGG